MPFSARAAAVSASRRGEGKGRRGWSVLGKGGEVLSEVRDAWGVAFLDMDEDVSGFLNEYGGGDN